MITAERSTIERNLAVLADVIESPDFEGRLLGIHLEGPFISPHKGAVGAHPPQHTLVPAAHDGCRLLDEWQAIARGHIRLLTLAAEVEGAAELCAHAVRNHGIAVSLGRTPLQIPHTTHKT